MRFTVCDISTPGSYVHCDRGFMLVRTESSGEARVPLQDLAALVITGKGITFSSGVLSKLGEQGIPVIICGPRFMPSSVLWPTSPECVSSRRIRCQIDSTKPKSKAAWKKIIQAKLMWQAATLHARGASCGPLIRLSKQVRSGDPSNVEAQAARHYWKLLFGTDFKRDVSGGAVNSALNYGYAVLRAAMSRAIAAAGLHPSISIMHCNHHNPYTLVDDLMEMFRPTVDLAVWHIRDSLEVDDLMPANKQTLARVLHQPAYGMGTSILMNHIYGLAVSYAQYLEGSSTKFTLDTPRIGIRHGTDQHLSPEQLSDNVDARYV